MWESVCMRESVCMWRVYVCEIESVCMWEIVCT